MLTTEQGQMKDFARRELAHEPAERYRTCSFPVDLMWKMGRWHRLFRDPRRPRIRRGGRRLYYVSLTQIISAIAEADGAFSTALLLHNVLVCWSDGDQNGTAPPTGRHVSWNLSPAVARSTASA